MDNIPLELLTAMVKLTEIRVSRLLALEYPEPKRSGFLDLYDEMEANQRQQVDIFLSMGRN
ncbi:hypothetical protein [Arthrobacter sp. 9MFCol3.1]|uniref:hypothetical protein n=1 Tax=Arthrobacter sp. 9MFCol3.1 TaxID=1150398 RepID=UPI0009E04EDB|nr:hypothetical protein [Arthrobacter sp. 9MFCol3.1]